MPTLRDRAEDIPLLAEYFLRMFAKTHKKGQRSMTPGYLGALARHSWPGNVRELQNVIERSVVLANGHERLGVDDLPPEMQGLSLSDELPRGSFVEAVRGFKRELVRSALAMHNGNKLKAARELGISRCYLHRLLNQLRVVEGREAAEVGEEEAELQEADVEILREEPEPAMTPVGLLRSSARIA
jgi:DNA-binding NtrC family response regulator